MIYHNNLISGNDLPIQVIIFDLVVLRMRWMSMSDGVDEFGRALCQCDGCDWPAEWHKDKELCEVHAAEE